MAIGNPKIHERCTVLRQELKVWEKQFSAANGGRKAGREDIKANAAIASKYKEYNRLRDVLSGRIPDTEPSKPARKPKPVEEASQTPSKRRSVPAATPKKLGGPTGNATLAAPSSISKLDLTPVAVRTMIGPTPQKDGIVIGLFDMPPSSAETPSKAQRTVLGGIDGNFPAQTPNKKRAAPSDVDTPSTKLSRTPLSEGKRFLLDTFATPTKRKRGDDGVATPMSERLLATPHFLRRDSHALLSAVVEEDDGQEATLSPQRPAFAPWKKRTFGRSLSGMIREMKQAQEDELDRELELMREMEEEEAAGSMPPPKKSRSAEVLVQDSQAVGLGPDGFVESDHELGEEEGRDLGSLDRDGNPRKVWKKKGLKRQTKRVIMRPVRIKPKAPQEAPANDSESEAEDAVPDTQAPPSLKPATSDDPAGDFDNEHSENDDGSDYSTISHASKRRKTQSKKAPELASKPAVPDAGAKDGLLKKTAKKISAQAHANFRKLKIKNKNSKAKGRFGRGRRQ